MMRPRVCRLEEGWTGTTPGGWGGGDDWGQKQRSIYLYPWESRQPWKSWLSLHRKSATCYTRAKLSRVEPRLSALRGPISSALYLLFVFSLAVQLVQS